MSTDASTDRILFVVDVAPADGSGAKINALAQTAMVAQQRVGEAGKSVSESVLSSTSSAIDNVQREFESASASVAEMTKELFQQTERQFQTSQQKVEEFFGIANKGISSPEEIEAGWDRFRQSIDDSGAALEETAQKALETELALNQAAQTDDFQKLDEVLGDIRKSMENLKGVTESYKELDEVKAEIEELTEAQQEFGDIAKESLGEAFKSAMDFTKGLAEIGLVSEENSEDILRGFMAIQGTYETIKGGYELVSSISKGLAALFVAKIADNAITSKTNELEALRIKHLQAEALAATAAAGANLELAAARAIANKTAGVTGGGGMGGGIVGNAVGGAAAEAASGAMGGAGGAAATGAGSAAVVTGTETAATSSAIFGIEASIAATAGVVVASLAGIAFGATILTEQLSGAANETGSFSHSISEMEFGIANWTRQLFGGDNLDHSEEQNKRRDEILARRQQDLQLEAIEGEASRKSDFSRQDMEIGLARDRAANSKAPVDLGAVMANATATAGVGATPEQFRSAYDAALKDAERIAQLQQQGAVESAEYESAMKSASEYSKSIADMAVHHATEGDAYKNAVERGSDAAERAIEAMQRQRDIARDISSIQIEGASRAVDILQQEINQRRDAIKQQEDARLSAAERFAGLDEIQQSQAIDALNRGRAGQELSKEERSLLRSVGGKEATGYARNADVADAKAAGFDQAFGSGFDTERNKLQNEISDLEVKLQKNLEVKVTLEANVDGAVQQFTGKLEELQRQLQDVLQQKIQESADKQGKELRDSFASQRANRR